MGIEINPEVLKTMTFDGTEVCYFCKLFIIILSMELVVFREIEVLFFWYSFFVLLLF